MGTQVYLGIGSNLNRDNALLFAVEKLKPLFSNFKLSPVYESKPIREAEPDFFNMVIGGTTELNLDELYSKLKSIEKQAGFELMLYNSTNFGLKHRLDIDILVFGDKVCTDPCKLPRHDIQDYPFVTIPLNDIAPDLVHPILKLTVKELCEQMLPHIPEKRQVQAIDFDFNRPAPDWHNEEELVETLPEYER